MAKTLSERIADRISKKNPTRADQNRATFISLRREVKASLEDGWPVKTIWETLKDEGKVTFSYQAFRGYVNRLILGKASMGEKAAPENPAALEQKEGQQAAKDTSLDEPSTAKKPVNKGFVFNPVPNDKELF
jgi:hypothetical protein